jgi:hypothetical protein
LSVGRGGGSTYNADQGTGGILEFRHDNDDYRHVTIESVSEGTFSSDIGLLFKTVDTGDGPQERMRIDAHGNVGIGTASPNAPLAVVSTRNADTWAADKSQLDVLNDNGSGSTYGMSLAVSQTHGDGIIQTFNRSNGIAQYDLRLQPNAGNVGIGTTSPSRKLDVVGGPTKSDGFILGTSNNIYYPGCIYTDSNWGMLFRSAVSSPGIADFVFNNYAGSNMMVIKNSNVGIGTTSPGAKLDVNGVIRNQNPSWSLYMGSSGYTSGYLRWDVVKASAINCTTTNNGGYYDRVTITVPGRYFIGFNAFANPNQNGLGWAYEIRKNGGSVVRSYLNPPNNNYCAMSGLGVVVDLVVNDYIQIYSDYSVHHSGNAPFYGFLIA